jgi:hypothetical protein
VLVIPDWIPHKKANSRRLSRSLREKKDTQNLLSSPEDLTKIFIFFVVIAERHSFD